MKNREYFLREDLDTFKRKFKAVCREKEFKTENFIEKVAQFKNNNYICRKKQIKIEEYGRL